MLRIGPLTDEQRQTLEQLRRNAMGRVAQRAHMVLLNARGYRVAELATIFAVGEDVVRGWLHRYAQEGADGLADRPRPGRPPRDPLAQRIVDAQASQAPPTRGLAQSCWTAGLLAAYLLSTFGLRLSPRRVRAHLRTTGWRWARPRLAPATHAPGAQRKTDPAAALKLRLMTQALASSATVLYLDECELHLLPVVRAMWMQGPRVRIPTPGQNAKRVLFGALDARSGRVLHLLRPRKRAQDFVTFLEHVAAAYPTGEVVLVLDNVITHRAQLVQRWLADPAHARIRLLWLPAYAAHEHNPIERVWGLLKNRVAANRLAGSIEVLADAAQHFLHELTFPPPHPGADATWDQPARAA
jgi:transposase